MFCTNCGTRLENNVLVCPGCGRIVKHKKNNLETKVKNKSENDSHRKTFAALLCVVGGFWGVHRFYLGYKKTAITMVSMFFLFTASIVGASVIGMIFSIDTDIDRIICWAYLGFFAVLIAWVGIDFILILLDKLQPRENSVALKVFPKQN